MKISFIIPAYNEENYIGNCLHTLLIRVKESKADVEIIVVNNASTDQTKEIVSRYSGVILINEPQKGLSRARQSGYEASTGDLIANVDADTVLPQGWIETVLESFEKTPKLVGLSGPQVFYDVPKLVTYWARLFYGITYVGYILNRFVFRVSSFLQGGNFVIRRTALDTIGGYNQDFKFYGEDADIAHRLHKIGPVKFTFKLPILASGRRIMVEGKFTMAYRYFMNYFWTIFTGRPYSEKSLDIRFVDGDTSEKK